ncbi:MAG: hypothetical protein IT361_12215 [Gemmatimonadaceae bacterium]|nr:hypothetical protein [Gemmatimonadaceae bacterium]
MMRLAAFAVLVFSGALSAQDSTLGPGFVRAPRDEVIAAMREEHRLGYNLRATANGARLQAGVLLRLAHAAHARDSLGVPFLVTFDDYEAAFREVTGVSDDSLPVFIRIATRYRESLLVEHRMSHVLERIIEGRQPLLALRVRGGWADASQKSYSYEDNSGSPHLRVRHDRDTRYTIVDYGNMVLHDQIRGIGGRATSGVLGLMFDLLGDARATQSRFAFADSGVQVARVSAKKGPFSVTQTVTVLTSGVAEKGTPRGRDDLKAIARTLERERVSLAYVADAPLPPRVWP